MKKFEYKVEAININTDTLRKLNKEGRKGWEVVETKIYKTLIEVLFKREITPLTEKELLAENTNLEDLI